jgi:sugar phosphate isomerase/epimerase
MQRRDLLCLLGTLPFSRLAAAGMPQRRLKSIGLQLYTVRAAMESDFEATLARIAAIGYRQVEFAGYFGRSAGAVRASLHSAGLSAPSAHISLAALDADWQRSIDDALAIGHRYLVVASAGDVPGGDGYRRLAERFNAAGEAARQAGIRFAYHNHDVEFRRRGGKLPYDVLLEATDPRYVCFELDIYWITQGGQNPIDYLMRWPGRIPLLHLKDAARAPPHRITEVGAGMIEWRAVLGRATQAGVEHFFVEQDDAADPMASIATSYGYLRDLRF